MKNERRTPGNNMYYNHVNFGCSCGSVCEVPMKPNQIIPDHPDKRGPIEEFIIISICCGAEKKEDSEICSNCGHECRFEKQEVY